MTDRTHGEGESPGVTRTGTGVLEGTRLAGVARWAVLVMAVYLAVREGVERGVTGLVRAYDRTLA